MPHIIQSFHDKKDNIVRRFAKDENIKIKLLESLF